MQRFRKLTQNKIPAEKNSKVYIIAEIGVNHNGDVMLAKELVDAAKTSGADCVKFQTFKADRLVSCYSPKAPYQALRTDNNETQFEMLKKLELDIDDHKDLMAYCRKQNIDFLTTPYSKSDVDLLEGIGIPAYKIASAHITEPDFLQHVAHTGKPIFLSTGMATLSEVAQAVSTIMDTGNRQLILFQCTTDYPARIQDANLLAITTMAAAFNTAVGYSDHTTTNTACLVAIGLGARFIEKHFTLDKKLSGPDHKASANPDEFQVLCESIREAEKSLGSGEKRPCDGESINASVMRRSLVASRKIRSGEIIKRDMIALKRPGTGISPARINEVIGCAAQCDIEKDALLNWSRCGTQR